MTVDLPSFEKELQVIENFIIEQKIQQSDNYKDWYDYFVKIYGKKRTNLHLYVINSFICFIAKLYIAKYILNLNQYSCKSFSELQKIIKEKFEIEFSTEIYYFNPFFYVPQA